MAARRREARPEHAGDRRRLPARHDEDLHRLGAELGLRQRPRLPVCRAAAGPRWVSGIVKGPLGPARVAGRELRRSDHAPLLRRQHRRHRRPRGRLPDRRRRATRRPSRGRCTSSASPARTRSGRGRRPATTSRRSARGSGTATTTRAAARRPSSTRSAPSWVARRGRVAAARRAATPRATSTSRPTRRRRASRPSAHTGRRAATSSRRARTPHATGWSVNGDYSFALCAPRPDARRRPPLDRASSTRAASAQRPVVTARTGAAAPTSS